jgi:hypothetical protein
MRYGRYETFDSSTTADREAPDIDFGEIVIARANSSDTWEFSRC